MTERGNVVLQKDPMRGVLEVKGLNKIQNRFCRVAGVFAFAMDTEGRMITDMSGDKDDVSVIFDKVGMDTFLRACRQVSENALEEQVIVETGYDNVRVAAISIRSKGAIYLNWIICAVLETTPDMRPENLLAGISRTISERHFLDMLDLMREITFKMVDARIQSQQMNIEAMKDRSSREDMSHSLKRIEAFTQVVSLLESDRTIEEVATQILKIAVQYLEISSGQVIRVNQDGTTMDILAEFCNQGIVSIFDQTRGLTRSNLLCHEKTYITSLNHCVNQAEREELNRNHIRTIAVIPITINGKISMYACFNECKTERTYDVDDIKFMNDAAKIIQSVMMKRIQKNSLISSYASLESILDHMGAAIYVEDVKDGRILFANRVLKGAFAEELENNSLKEIFVDGKPVKSAENHYEVQHLATGNWYEIHASDLKWVDGRASRVYAAYDITEKKNYQKKIEQQAYTDFLTGLFNRMCCERDLAWHIDEAKKKGQRGALLYLDLDDFKHINDGLGHQYGDVLLKAISHSLQRIEGITNTCYRMGGDEFVIIVPIEYFPKVSLIIEDIKSIFSKPWFLKDADYYCTMSMGVVEFPTAGENVQDLIKKADIAMYEAKKSGKNRVAEYRNNSDSVSSKRLDMEKNMRDATVQGYQEFEVYYQPIVDISKEGTPCCGAEALIRWNSQELGFVPPAEFIPLAEYLGLINPIGNYVLREACKTCKYWNDNGKPDYKVNVNLSVVQLLQTDIKEIVEQALEETGINPRNLTLEVTESLAINDMQRMKEILDKIRQLGVRIALDDFGTGYSSLNHIREISFDVIKVDQSFVRDLAEDAYSQSFIKMVGELANTIGVSLCVEGIETKEQYKVLEGMQVRMIQGYYFDRPMPRERFESKYVYHKEQEQSNF